MRILVTGASGFVGQALVRAVAEAGHTGTAVSRRVIHKLPPGWKWLAREEALRGGFTGAFDALIHLEVKQHIQNPSPEDLREFDSVNVQGTRAWLDWASRQAIPLFLFFSTIKAAGDSPDCQDESSVSLPTSPYGKSKLAAEQEVRRWAGEGVGRRAIIVRPAVVYGPGNEANLYAFVEAVARRRFFLVGKNANVKSLVSLRNVTAAVLHLLKLKTPGNCETFYLVDRQSFTVADLGRMILSVLGRQTRLPVIPVFVAKTGAALGDLFVSVTGKSFPLTSTRLKALLENTHFSCKKLESTGFVHPQSTEDGLREMLDWYLKKTAAA